MDSIADMLVRIQNAIRIREETVDLPHSKVKEGIARILLEEGYVSNLDTFTRMNKRFLRIRLKYTEAKKSVIAGMKRISSSSRRIYVGADSIPRVQCGFGTAIVTTPKGLMTDEQAREKKLGGEILCYVW